MAKIKAPLFSLDATGTLDKNITYKGKKQSNIAQKYSKPGAVNPFESSPRQKDQRSIIRLITIHWQCMSSSDKLSWEVAAKDKRFKGSGYHYFLHMAQQNLTQYLGLVGYWSMNYNIDDKIPDLSGNANHGTLSPIYPCDSPTFVDSINKKYGKALSFDGITNFVTCADSPSLRISGNDTIELFLKPILGVTSVFIHKDGLTPDRGWYFLLFDNGRIRRVLALSSTSVCYFTTTTSILTGVWTHVTSRFDGLSINIYFNGIKQPGSYNVGVPATQHASSEDLFIGKKPASFYSGLIDDVRIYNRALSEEEIKKHSLS